MRKFRQILASGKGVLAILLGLAGLTVGVLQIDTVQEWLSRASGQPANIIVDTKGELGTLRRSWANLAQGGESPDYRFAPVTNQLQQLAPQYIRIDHVFNYNNVVSRGANGQLVYNWSKLDTLISDILAVGAKPYITLTYMPSALGSDLTGLPNRWSEWQELVRRTVEHISGASGFGIDNVYYEVWNEPDLFGNFKTYGAKNYLELYRYSVLGAQQAENVQPFKIGGPGTTALYPNWVTDFFRFADEHQLRVDFYSWHRYHYNLSQYEADVATYDRLVRDFPHRVFTTERHITEWGPNSDLSPANDGQLAAAHMVAVSATLNPFVNRLFTFEAQDGLDPEGKAYWGRWGLLTHQQFGSQAKPRYFAMQMLQRLGMTRVSLVGEGTWVRGLAAKKEDGTVQILLANYDSRGSHTERVPVTFQRLDPGQYTLTQEYLGRSPTTLELDITTEFLGHEVTMPPNSVVMLELKSQNNEDSI